MTLKEQKQNRVVVYAPWFELEIKVMKTSLLVDKSPHWVMVTWLRKSGGLFLVRVAAVGYRSVTLKNLDALALKLQNMVLDMVFNVRWTVENGRIWTGDGIVRLLVQASELFGGAVVSVIW